MMKLGSLAIKKFQSKDCLFLFKGGWSLLIRRLSIDVTLKSLLVAKIEKSSKSCAWLQNERRSLIAESSSPLTLFPMSAEIFRCSHLHIVYGLQFLARTVFGNSTFNSHFKFFKGLGIGLFLWELCPIVFDL